MWILIALLFALPAFGALGKPVAFSMVDRSGYARVNEPVTSGLPIPQSAGITDVDTLMLTDAQGNAIPAQLKVTARWGGAPGDTTKPIKWVLADLLGNVDANGASTYYLADRTAPAAADPSVSVSSDAQYVTVNTGAMMVKIRKDRFTFLDTVVAGGRTFTAPDGGGFSVVADGVVYTSAKADRSYRMTVEAAGPERAQIHVCGRFFAGLESRMEYDMRLIFYAGSTTVKVYPTLVFSDDMFAFKPSRIVLTAPVQLGGGANYSIGNDGAVANGSLGAGESVGIHQFDYNANTIVRTGQPAQSGGKSDGWLDVSDSSGGVSVWMRDLWQQYPLQLEYAPGALNVYFWPGQDYSDVVKRKIEAAMAGKAQDAVIWPFVPGSNLDLTAAVPNPNRLPISITNANPPVAIVPGWGKQPVGSTQQMYVANMPGPNWSALNGYINATCIGMSNGYCQLQLGDPGQFDSTDWGPYLTGNCLKDRTLPSCPHIGQVQMMTEQNAQGIAKTWELQYDFHGNGADPAAFAARARDRLLLANPAWTASSLVFGRIHEKDTDNFRRAEAAIDGAFSNMLAKDAAQHMYGMPHYGDTAYTQDASAGGYGDRYFTHSRKNAEMVPWLLYARSGDPRYLWYGVARALHTMDVDVQHVTRADYRDANGNVVSKRKGGGIVSHAPHHWYSVYGGHPLGTEGEEPTLEYFTDAGLAMYYLLGYDRAAELIVERADQVIWYDAQRGGNIFDHLGARSFGGCLQISLDAWKLTGAQKYMDLADQCFSSAVGQKGGFTLLTPMGYLNGSPGGNEINWSLFCSSWANLPFAEYAEIKGPDAVVAGKSVRQEFLRFAKAMSAMGLTNDTTSAATYGYQCKSTAYAYAYTGNAEFLKFGRRWFDMLTAYPEGAHIVYGPFPDVHDWSQYLLNLPYCEWMAAQKEASGKPDWAPYYFHVPTGAPVRFIVNKAADQDWSVSMTFDAGVDFADDFNLSGLITVDIVDPKGATIQHNQFQTPNLMTPDSANPPSIAHGGVDNRVRTFRVPADGQTGEYSILVSVAPGAQPPGCPLEGGPTVCYSTNHAAAALASSLGNLTMVLPPYSADREQSPRLGRGLYYFYVPPGTTTLWMSYGYAGFWLVDPDGVVYPSNGPAGATRYTVSPKPGYWALGTNISNENGGVYGVSMKSDGARPLFSASPQYLFNSDKYPPLSTYTSAGNLIIMTFQ